MWPRVCCGVLLKPSTWCLLLISLLTLHLFLTSPGTVGTGDKGSLEAEVLTNQNTAESVTRCSQCIAIWLGRGEHLLPAPRHAASQLPGGLLLGPRMQGRL